MVGNTSNYTMKTCTKEKKVWCPFSTGFYIHMFVFCPIRDSHVTEIEENTSLATLMGQI